MFQDKFKIGGTVYDEFFGVYGHIIDNKDIHNILIEYEGGGSGLYCLDKRCKDFDPDIKLKNSNN